MKTALITGGSRGIGRATVELLAQSGYQTAFCYLNNDAAASEVERLTGALKYKVDISVRRDVDAMVEDIVSKFGRIDLLVNNAAVSAQKLFTEITEVEWNRMLAVNLTGAFNCTQSVAQYMVKQKFGKIVFVSSMWGVSGGSCEVHYSATKAALIGMTKALAKELGPSGITVNCVAPGVIDTDMNCNLSNEDFDELKESTPLLRIGTTHDVAKAIAFLGSDAADFITGQVLGVDGGIIV